MIIQYYLKLHPFCSLNNIYCDTANTHIKDEPMEVLHKCKIPFFDRILAGKPSTSLGTVHATINEPDQ